MATRRRPPAGRHRYPRSARLSETLREVLARAFAVGHQFAKAHLSATQIEDPQPGFGGRTRVIDQRQRRRRRDVTRVDRAPHCTEREGQYIRRHASRFGNREIDQLVRHRTRCGRRARKRNGSEQTHNEAGQHRDNAVCQLLNLFVDAGFDAHIRGRNARSQARPR